MIILIHNINTGITKECDYLVKHHFFSRLTRANGASPRSIFQCCNKGFLRNYQHVSTKINLKSYNF